VNPPGTPLYKAIRKISGRLLQKYIRAGKFPSADGRPCVDCGATKYVCWDHRDYSEALTVEPVCYSCNGRRGPGLVEALDLDSWQWVRVPARHGAA